MNVRTVIISHALNTKSEKYRSLCWVFLLLTR